MTINLVKLKRSEVFAFPDQHGHRERVFVVPQLCQIAIGEGLHEFFDRIVEGVLKAYLDLAQAERDQDFVIQLAGRSSYNQRL
jgi:hypothetical protein